MSLLLKKGECISMNWLFTKLTVKFYNLYSSTSKLWNKTFCSGISLTTLKGTWEQHISVSRQSVKTYLLSHALRELFKLQAEDQSSEALLAFREKTHSIPTGQGNELCPEVNHQQIPSHWEREKQWKQQHPVTSNPKIRCFSSLARSAFGLTR